ncbi:5-formyltetrahydrofolate cyclo-ligase [Glaciecola sp. 1036]|uniref:5-formyltetrahydrofolate cyclo-ligase n=1 Tax=Alteromonadaceae TaxID=72275 RepID=UPI003CFC101A
MKEPTTTQLRNTLRQTFRERRKSLSHQEQHTAALGLVDQIQSLDVLQGASKVALYMTNDSELDTQPLIEHLWQQNVKVYLPVLHPFSDGYLLFLHYHPNSVMTANHYGIAEPRLDCRDVCPVANLDVLFTPLVAFDASGNRLGMGGGFYDRTLAFLHNNKQNQPKLIGLAHDIQQTLSLPTEAWDIPLPTIITPTQHFSFT